MFSPSDWLTTLELLAGLGGIPPDAGGENGYLDAFGESLSEVEMPSPLGFAA